MGRVMLTSTPHKGDKHAPVLIGGGVSATVSRTSSPRSAGASVAASVASSDKWSMGGVERLRVLIVTAGT